MDFSKPQCMWNHTTRIIIMVKNLFIKALLINASGKTKRYFLKDAKETMNKLILTVESIRNSGKNTPIECGGVSYFAEDYKFPQIMVDYINTKHMYFNSESTGMGDFVDDYVDYNLMLAGESSDADLSQYVDDTQTDCLSPEQVSAFFKAYNENQSSEDSIELVDVKFTRYTLSDFKELSLVKGVVTNKSDGTEVTQMVNWSSAGSKSGILALLGGIVAPVDSRYLSKTCALTFEEAASWIFKK